MQAFELLGLRSAMIGTLGSGNLEQLSYVGQTSVRQTRSVYKKHCVNTLML